MKILIGNPRLFSLVAALSFLIQASPACWAADTTQSQDPTNSSATAAVAPDAILGLDMAPSSLPDITQPQAGADKASPAPIAVTPSTNEVASAEVPAVSFPILDAVSAGASAPGTYDNSVLRGGVIVSPGAAQTRIDELTRQILLKEIEMERFNINYTLNVAKQGRWKGWRYAAFQEVNAGMGLTGAIIGTAERGTHIHSPNRVHTELQESANYIPEIGSWIGAYAALQEFAINEAHDLKARGRGFNPGAAVAHVSGLKKDINALLTEREALIAVEGQDHNLAAHVEVDQAEGKILRDLRDESLQEFERFHIGARKLLAFQQSQYFFDFSKYVLNALGYQFAYESLHVHRRFNNGIAGILWDVAGPIYMIGPILSRVIGHQVGEIHRHRLRPTTQDAENAKVDELVADHALLDKLCSQLGTSDSAKPAVERSSMYGLHEKTFQDEIRKSEKDRDKAKLTATQNIGAGIYVGGTKLAQGILFTISGTDHNYRSKTFRADRVTNSDLFVGSVISIPAGVFSMLDTLRIQVNGEVNRHRLAKAGMLPGQLAKERLAQLDNMEAQLKR